MNGPIVFFKDETIDEMISQWLRVSSDYAHTYLGIILSKLGFCSQDMIYVFACTQDRHLCFKVNDELGYSIHMKKNRSNGIPIAYFCKDNVEVGYQCLIDKYGRFDIELKPLLSYGKISEEIVEEKDETKEYVDYTVSNNQYVVELRVSKSYGWYQLDNQDKLFEYLSKLEFPVSIFDVYKKICEISIRDDVSKYSLIDLRILKWMEDEESLGQFEIIDLITISDGELVALLVTKDNKQIYSNKIGIWSCDMERSLVEFSTLKMVDSIEFNTKVKPKEDIENYTEELASEDVMDAKIEVAKVRRLASGLIPKKK